MRHQTVSLCSALFLATGLFAAPEKVASVRLGGTEKIVAAVGKIGAFTGNETLGAMCSGAIMQSEVIQYFGPTRPGANVFLQLYADATKTNDAMSASVLYPVVAKKAKFLKHHKGAVEKDGVITMPKNGNDAVSYVVFSADGKWAAFAKEPALAKEALANVAEAERPLGSDLLRFDIASRGMAGLVGLAEATRAKGRPADERIDRATLDILRATDYASLALRVTDAGIDFDCSSQVKPGTELAKAGLSPYDEKVFASLGRDVFVAAAIGRDSTLPRKKAWKDFIGFLRAHGLRFDFLDCQKTPGLTRVTLDVQGLVKYCQGPATNAFAKLDAKRFAEDFAKFAKDMDEKPYAAKNPADALACALKGCSGKFTPAERLKATLPELAGKKPFYVSCGSGYAIVRALLPVCLKAMADEETAAALTPMMAVLAPDSASGIASGMWREGDSFRAVARISAAEIKGFASCFALMSAYSAATAGDDGDEDDSSDDSDDKDED